MNETILLDKKIVCYGDSTTQGQTQAEPPYFVGDNYPSELAKITGAIVENRGLGGTTASTANSSNAFCNRVDTEDLSEFDYCIIMYGTNEYGLNVSIGSANNTKTTFLGAMSYGISKIQSRFPDCKIVLMTPLYSNVQYKRNALGLTMQDYVNAVLYIADYYKVPCIDISKLLGVNDLNIRYKYWDGALHPTGKTYREIGVLVANQLLGSSVDNKLDLWYSLQTVNGASVPDSSKIPMVTIRNGCIFFRGLVSVGTNGVALTIPHNFITSNIPYNLTLPMMDGNGAYTFVTISTSGNIYFNRTSTVYDLVGLMPFAIGGIATY